MDKYEAEEETREHGVLSEEGGVKSCGADPNYVESHVYHYYLLEEGRVFEVLADVFFLLGNILVLVLYNRVNTI